METDTNREWVPWAASIAGILIVAVVLVITRWFMQGRQYRGKERLDGKVVIITGCNTGIGKAHALDMARRGARVYMACRDFRRCEDARLEIVQQSGNENVFNSTLDLGSLASVRAFVTKFLSLEQRLDILVNNAAIIPADQQKTVDGFEMQMGVNHMGPFLLTTLLVDVLRKSAPSRVIVVSSTGHFMGTIVRDDLNTERTAYSQVGNYCNSKLANMLFMRGLSKRLAGSGVTVNALHPGVVRTELIRDLSWWWTALMWSVRFFARTPAAGAQTQIRLSVDASLEKVTGTYWDNCREDRPSEKVLDDELVEWLWRTSEEATRQRV